MYVVCVFVYTSMYYGVLLRFIVLLINNKVLVPLLLQLLQKYIRKQYIICSCVRLVYSIMYLYLQYMHSSIIVWVLFSSYSMYNSMKVPLDSGSTVHTICIVVRRMQKYSIYSQYGPVVCIYINKSTYLHVNMFVKSYVLQYFW